MLFLFIFFINILYKNRFNKLKKIYCIEIFGKNAILNFLIIILFLLSIKYMEYIIFIYKFVYS